MILNQKIFNLHLHFNNQTKVTTSISSEALRNQICNYRVASLLSIGRSEIYQESNIFLKKFKLLHKYMNKLGFIQTLVISSHFI